MASKHQVYKDLRYKKISKIFKTDEDFSLHDVGFGLNHYYEYLQQNFKDRPIVFSGSEVTKAFVDHCVKEYPNLEFFLRDLSEPIHPEYYDYITFSGTFYHLSNTNPIQFQKDAFNTLKNGFDASKKGISFNLMSEYVEFRYDTLFYPNLVDVIDFTVKNYHVSLLSITIIHFVNIPSTSITRHGSRSNIQVQNSKDIFEF